MDGGRQGISNESFLTDTMIVVSIDPKTGRIAFISLPRDMVNIPMPGGGKFPGKINTLYTTARVQPGRFAGSDRDRGYRALMGALSALYGIKIEYYASVDLNSFRDAINVLGGVVVDVQVPVYDTAYTASDGRGKLKLYFPAGMQWMNGQRALAYARSRHDTSDFDRAARQQRLFSSVRDQTDLSALFAPGVLDKLLKQVTKHVKTNIPPRMVPKLVSLAQEVNLDRRVNLVLSEPTYGSICYPCPPYNWWAITPNVPRNPPGRPGRLRGEPPRRAGAAARRGRRRGRPCAQRSRRREHEGDEHRRCARGSWRERGRAAHRRGSRGRE